MLLKPRIRIYQPTRWQRLGSWLSMRLGPHFFPWWHRTFNAKNMRTLVLPIDNPQPGRVYELWVTGPLRGYLKVRYLGHDQVIYLAVHPD